MGSCKTNSSDINKTFVIEPLSVTGGSPTLSACTAMFTSFITPCSGDTVTISENLNVTGSVSADTYNGLTYLSGGTNIIDILRFTGGSENCIDNLYVTNVYGCSPITINDTLVFKDNLEPDEDGKRLVGTRFKRFREVNTKSGRTTLWTATTRVTTAEVDLGLDSDNNVRKITANNSIIQYDILRGGTY